MSTLYNLWSVTLREMLGVWGLIMEKNTLAEYQKDYQLLRGRGGEGGENDLNFLNYID